MKNRQIKDREVFINPDYNKLADPFSVPGMKEAVKRIKKATAKKEKVGIFMDYDADGIPGGAIIYKAFQILGVEAIPYVPKREDGYGLNEKAIKSFQQSDVSLLITVDCGIGNAKEIAYAKKNEIETIVTDHHELGDDLPEAINVHPLIEKNNKLRFRDFSGGGVAFLLAKALASKTGQEKWLLDLAAISSIADVVSLKEDNRLIVKYGLLVLNKTRNLGLRALSRTAGLKKGLIGTYEVGYMIAPRINAAGRISSPRKSFELLTTDNLKRAEELAKELDQLNTERQEILEKARNEAEERILAKGLFKNKIVVLKNPAWPEGIIGLVAGKIAQKFWRPAIILNEREGKIKGSARSIPGINITEFLSLNGKYLLNFGGHEQAAGLTLKKDRFKAFEKSVLKNSLKLKDELFEKNLKIDAVVEENDLKLSLAKALQKLEPFGAGNPKPVLALENAKIVSIRRVGREGKHLKIEIEKSARTHSVICFYFERNGWDLKRGEIVDLAFSLKANEFNGREKLDMVLEDVRKK